MSRTTVIAPPRPESRFAQDSADAYKGFKIFARLAQLKALVMGTHNIGAERHRVYSNDELQRGTTNTSILNWLNNHPAVQREMTRIKKIFADVGYSTCELRSDHEGVHVFVSKQGRN